MARTLRRNSLDPGAPPACAILAGSASGFVSKPSAQGEGLPHTVGGPAAAVYVRPAESPLSVRLVVICFGVFRRVEVSLGGLGDFRIMHPDTRETVATLTPSATPTIRLRKTREIGRLVKTVSSGGVREPLERANDSRPTTGLQGVRTVSFNDRSGWMCNLGVNSSPRHAFRGRRTGETD